MRRHPYRSRFAYLALVALAACGGEDPAPDGAVDAASTDGGPGVTCDDPDGDGFGPGCDAGDDCEPADPAAYPGADEVCDGDDDDCDGAIDEGCECEPAATQPCGSSVGACEQGVQRCGDDHLWSACEGGVGPADEACEGAADEDCDGSIDEGCECVDGAEQPCGTDEGICTMGTQVCAGGTWGACEGSTPPAAAEACDARLDEDCDGAIDEGCDCRSSGCFLGFCDPVSATCATTLPGYALHDWIYDDPPLSLHVTATRAWVGQRYRRLLWGEATASGDRLLPDPVGDWAANGVSPVADPASDLQWVMGATRGLGPTAASADVGSLSGGRRHTADLGYAPGFVVRTRYDGADLYAVLVGRAMGLGGNSHSTHLLVESGGTLTHTVLASASDTSFVISDVDFRVVAGGRVEVLVVGSIYTTPRQAVAHLIDFDAGTADYRRRRFVVEPGTGGDIAVGGAFDRDGAPTVVVRRPAGSDPADGELGLHRFDGTAWTREALPDRTRAADAAAVAFTRGNRPIVALVGTDGGIELVRETAPGAWVTDVIPNTPWTDAAGTAPRDFAYVGDVEMRLDDLGRPVVVFAGATDLVSPIVSGTFLFVPTP